MKYLIIFILGVLSISAYGQNTLEYSEVVEVEGVTQKELFKRARMWFNRTYKDSKEILNIIDKESGELSGKAQTGFTYNSLLWGNTVNGIISYRISIYVKEGRYKYVIQQFIHEGAAYNGGQFKVGLITLDEHCPYQLLSGSYKIPQKRADDIWKDIKEKIYSEKDYLIKSIEKGMKIPSESSDDW